MCDLQSLSVPCWASWLSHCQPAVVKETNLGAGFWLECVVLIHAGAALVLNPVQLLCLQGPVVPLHFSSDCGAIRWK